MCSIKEMRYGRSFVLCMLLDSVSVNSVLAEEGVLSEGGAGAFSAQLL
jgi:hypothetical protein